MRRKHDELFKYTFSNPERAANALRRILPAAIAAAADWSTLTLLPGSFIDKKLRGRHTDLLYKVQIRGRTVCLHIIFEHQSQPDPLMPMRVVEYTICVWRGLLEEKPELKQLPPVIPVVLYNGEREWSTPQWLSEMYALDGETLAELKPWLPEATFALQDLARTDDELLEASFDAAVALILGGLKHGWGADDFVDWLTRSVDLARRVMRAQGGMEVLAALFRYAFSADVTLERLEPVAHAVGEEAKEVLMTAADRLIEQGVEIGLEKGRAEGRAEGRVEGRVEGRIEGQRQSARQLLITRFGELSDENHERIEALTLESLSVIYEQIFTANGIDELLEAAEAFEEPAED